jgi:hypothetical protein
LSKGMACILYVFVICNKHRQMTMSGSHSKNID